MTLTVTDVAPTTLNAGNDAASANTLAGTRADEIIQGGAGNDTITSGGGDDIIIGGTGDDTITLGTGSQTVVYRIESMVEDGSALFSGFMTDIDKFDTINNFTIGEDKLLFVDTGTGGITTLDDFLDAIKTVRTTFITDDEGVSYNTIAFHWYHGDTDRNSFEINFTNKITGDLAAEIKAASTFNGTSVNAANAKLILPKIFTSDGGSEGDLLTFTIDTTPLDITIL